ncbi:MAG TPA: T9SS type A sorting domain-containing protein [Bacteroidetes bacterium]|nr:T9SS type A sorting domain-containing protein [Bacteroidota bacterium]HIL58147.1 T9SS type A sorting domain-containing protein [Rhodothermales bacterium]
MLRLLVLLALAVPAALAQTAPDTLRHLPPGTDFVLHEYTGAYSGYILGHNSRGTEEYAERYHIDGSGRLIGVIAHIQGVVAHPNHVAGFNAYRVAASGLPNALIGSKQLFYGDLDLSGEPMLVRFSAPVAVADSFFVSFNVGDYSHGGYDGDDVALLAGPDGSRTETGGGSFGQNAVRLHNHGVRDWADLYTQNFTPVATHLALFPIVELANATAAEEAPAIVSMDLTLRAAYPNPARGAATVAFELAAPADVRVDLYDVAGRLVRGTDLGARGTGAHTHALDLEGLAPGAYVYAVSAGPSRLFSTLTIAH